jgi:hypothetical protein
VEFRRGVIPVLHAFANYLQAITDLFLLQTKQDHQQKKYEVERVLQARRSHFPGWVYEVGFNSVFQQGYRHFLVRLEQMAQILFSMHYLARHASDPEIIKIIDAPLQACVHQTIELMATLALLLDLKITHLPAADFSEKMHVLNNTLQQLDVLPPELLDVSHDYFHVAEFIEGLKDLQSALVNLSKTIR